MRRSKTPGISTLRYNGQASLKVLQCITPTSSRVTALYPVTTTKQKQNKKRALLRNNKQTGPRGISLADVLGIMKCKCIGTKTQTRPPNPRATHDTRQPAGSRSTSTPEASRYSCGTSTPRWHQLAAAAAAAFLLAPRPFAGSITQMTHLHDAQGFVVSPVTPHHLTKVGTRPTRWNQGVHGRARARHDREI